jgi:hypothetical protein
MEAVNNLWNRLITKVNKEYIKRKARKRITAVNSLNDKEKIILKIVTESLFSAEAILLIAPISSIQYIKMPSKEIFVILSGCNVVISNHKFYYDIDISENLANTLYERFNKVMDRRQRIMEKDMVSGLIDGLTDLSNKIENINT